MTSTTSLRSRTLALTAVLSLALATGAAAVVAENLPASHFLGGSDHSFESGREEVDKLDPALRSAIQEAARDAERAGVELRLNSGWRSSQHQEQLFDDALRKYGTPEEASRWVASPETSPHVRGAAVDVGPPKGARWLAEHGTDYGLCRTFENEAWHFELVTTRGGVCPAMAKDASVLR